jgi:spoIIIJ-associated protein
MMSNDEDREAEQTGDDPGSIEGIAGFTGELVEAWGLDLEPHVAAANGVLVVDFTGEDAALLLERRGELLDALQVILSRVLPARFGTRCRVVADSRGYRQAREHEIVEIALRTAERVKKLREPVVLSPMNPYERRLIHITLSDDPSVTTSSDGDGFMKRVRILPG